MIFGPFSTSDAEEITHLLNQKGVAFSRWKDTGIRDRQVCDWRNHLPTAQDLPVAFAPRFEFVDIEIGEIEDPVKVLANFGIRIRRPVPDAAAKNQSLRPIVFTFGLCLIATSCLLVWSWIHPLFNLTLAGSLATHRAQSAGHR